MFLKDIAITFLFTIIIMGIFGLIITHDDRKRKKRRKKKHKR